MSIWRSVIDYQEFGSRHSLRDLWREQYDMGVSGMQRGSRKQEDGKASRKCIQETKWESSGIKVSSRRESARKKEQNQCNITESREKKVDRRAESGHDDGLKRKPRRAEGWVWEKTDNSTRLHSVHSWFICQRYAANQELSMFLSVTNLYFTC